jgi:hypothetical protein
VSGRGKRRNGEVKRTVERFVGGEGKNGRGERYHLGEEKES